LAAVGTDDSGFFGWLVQRRRLFNEAAEDASDEEEDKNAGDENDADRQENAERTPEKLTEFRFNHRALVLRPVYHDFSCGRKKAYSIVLWAGY